MLEGRSNTGQPTLEELTKWFVNRQVNAATIGLASGPSNDVELYEAVPVQAVDPRQAWEEATYAARAFGAATSEIGKPIPEWPQLVAAQASVAALPLAAGNFPQMVRDLSPILRSVRLADLLTPPETAIELSGLARWTRSKDCGATFPRMLLAIGALRMARMFEAADRLLGEFKLSAPAHYQAAIANEEAAQKWQCGECDAAAEMWESLPESMPILFNRGMSGLFLGRTEDARLNLRKAAEQISDSSGWHHLSRLYLALTGG